MTETAAPEFPGYRLQSLIGTWWDGPRVSSRATRHVPGSRCQGPGSRHDRSREAGPVFRREAATVAQLEHPHVVPLYDYGDHQGTQYLVFRFLTGGTVADGIKAGPIPVDTALRWLDDVADALDAAHQRGIVHRDVKPSNLLLDEWRQCLSR